MKKNKLIPEILTKVTYSLKEIPIYLRIVIIIAITIGIFLRFYNLDGHLYSLDETFSTTNIFGRDVVEIIDVKIVNVEEIQSYQKLNPQESFMAATQRLIEKPYVFPPLYSILMQIWARFWTNFLDSPAIITRSLSAFISLFSLPFMYWLCWELFASTRIPWIGASLIAISPFHLQYSEIVRTYSLMTAAILLASATLLRAIRLQNRKNWILYAITIAIGLYSNLLFIPVLFAHSTYIILLQRFKINKLVKSYIIYSLVGFSLFLPWLIAFITRPGLLDYSVAQPVSKSFPLSTLISIWIKQVYLIFIDLVDPWREYTKKFIFLQDITSILVLLVVVGSLFLTLRYIQNPVSIFILSLIFWGGITLMIKDAAIGGIFSTRLRYVIPYVIGIELSVIFAYSCWQNQSLWLRKLSNIIVLILVLGGILSSILISNAESWWAFGAPDYPAMAARINQKAKPVVIYDDFGDALTMSYMLNSHVYFHLTRNLEEHLLEKKGKFYADYSDIIVFKPSKETINLINQAGYKVEPLFNSQENYPKQPNLVKIDINK